MQGMELCWKCGLEGLFIHTTGVAQMMRRKGMRDNMFHEILQASGVAHTEQRAWRSTLVDRMERDSAERRNTQEKDRDTQQVMIALLKHQMDILEILIDLRVQVILPCLPLQSIDNCILGPPYAPCPYIPHIFWGHCSTPTLYPEGEYTQSELQVH